MEQKDILLLYISYLSVLNQHSHNFNLTRLNNLDTDYTRVDSAGNGNCAMITQINGLFDDGYYPNVPFYETDPPSSSIMTPEQRVNPRAI